MTLCRFCSTASPAIETLNQRDGIHPTAEGARIVADNVWAVLEPIVGVAAKGTATR